MERRLKYWSLPKIRGRMHQTRPSTLFSPIFSLAREKIGPPEARQKRPRRNESLQARLLILCARFFLSKPQTEFAVWVLSQICDNLSVSAAPCQHPYPFCPFGTFPPDRGNRPLEGEPFPRKKVTSIWISKAPSIDSNCSTATSYKFGTPVSGGAYQDARKVSLVWNARPKHWDLPECRCSMHPIVTKRPFSPLSFPARRKR